MVVLRAEAHVCLLFMSLPQPAAKPSDIPPLLRHWCALLLSALLEPECTIQKHSYN